MRRKKEPKRQFEKMVVLDADTVFEDPEEDPRWQFAYDLAKEVQLLSLDPDTSEEEISAAIGDADAVGVNKVPLSNKLLRSKKKTLRFIQVLAVGVNILDTRVTDKLGIVVANTPEYAEHTVSEFVVFLIGFLLRRFDIHLQAVMNGIWRDAGKFSVMLTQQELLRGKTVTIYGFGRIGKAIARLLIPFGVKILVYDKYAGAIDGFEHKDKITFFSTPCKTLFAQADVFILQCSFKKGSKPIIREKTLAWMKPTCRIVNAGRGALVDMAALIEARKKGLIGTSGHDVVRKEPPDAEMQEQIEEVCGLGDVVLPHIAWSAVEARDDLLNKEYKENAEQALKGKKVARAVGKVNKLRKAA